MVPSCRGGLHMNSVLVHLKTWNALQADVHRLETRAAAKYRVAVEAIMDLIVAVVIHSYSRVEHHCTTQLVLQQKSSPQANMLRLQKRHSDVSVEIESFKQSAYRLLKLGISCQLSTFVLCTVHN